MPAKEGLYPIKWKDSCTDNGKNGISIMSDSSKPAVLLAPLEGLSPLLSPDIHTVILGSFPGRESLAASQYYAHPRNQFWRLLSDVLNDNLAQLPYEERLPRLLTHQSACGT